MNAFYEHFYDSAYPKPSSENCIGDKILVFFYQRILLQEVFDIYTYILFLIIVGEILILIIGTFNFKSFKCNIINNN